jgi:hypothetical protein
MSFEPYKWFFSLMRAKIRFLADKEKRPPAIKKAVPVEQLF